VRRTRSLRATARAVLAGRPHLIRYVLVGLVCTALQLALFHALWTHAVPPASANSLAFLTSTQVNFALSHRFTWAHRYRGGRLPVRRLLGRALAFNIAAMVGLGINAAAFLALRAVLALAPLPSAVIAVAVSTGVTYLVNSRLIFVPVHARSPYPSRMENVMAVPTARGSRAQTAHTALPRLEYDARVTVTPVQKRVLVILAVISVGVVVAAALGRTGGLLVLVGLVTVLYLADLVFCAYLVTGSMRRRNTGPDTGPQELDPWPRYTVLCPLYREATVLPQLVRAIRSLDYPVGSLEVLLLLEEDDTETIRAVRGLDLPAPFQMVVVPDGEPKTKPKACNDGLRIARGEYVVISTPKTYRSRTS
jgi:putative flippase GtrA